MSLEKGLITIHSLKIIPLCVFFLTSIASATIIHVPLDQTTIQAGIDVSADGDTVLVDTGTYVENINFNGKSIVVGSLFLTTGDTSYISQTVIDGNRSGSVVTFENLEDSTTELKGFTITNGKGGGYPYYNSGGGITCRDNSSPTLAYLKISGNFSVFGGGIACYKSSPILKSVTIRDNKAPYSGSKASYGGGISCYDQSNPSLVNVNINNNMANDNGGGIYCRYNSNPSLVNVILIGNTARVSGGAISCRDNSSPSFINVLVVENSAGVYGGGIFCNNSSLSLINVTVDKNTADYGGGIVCNDTSSLNLKNVRISGNVAKIRGGGIYCRENSSVSFDYDDRCDIYFNHAGSGGESYAYNCSTIEVVVDTFTVMNPTDYHAHPVRNFTFNIQKSKIEQVNNDLYVSSEGDDSNSGLSPSEPLLTISSALSKILADSLHPHTIYLVDGVYSYSTTGEKFPLNMVSYVSIFGKTNGGVILNAEGQNRVLFFDEDNHISIENVTITGGSAIYSMGGGVLCYHSSPSFINAVLRENKAHYGGGIFCDNSNPSILNVTMSNNTARHSGGGIFCFNNSSPTLVNTILWGDFPQEIYFYGKENPNSITVAYSDLQGGEEGILTNNNGMVYWLDGNINSDPLFIDAENGDFNLQQGSPCIDAGTEFFVWEGDTLVTLAPDDYQGNAPDMGAFESPYAVGIDDNQILPRQFILYQNYPNPFNPITTIHYDLPERADVTLTIYDILGRQVRTLVKEERPAGYHSVIWNGKDEVGMNVSASVYIYRIQAHNSKGSSYVKAHKMLLLK